jgi:hypothetical protein
MRKKIVFGTILLILLPALVGCNDTAIEPPAQRAEPERPAIVVQTGVADIPHRQEELPPNLPRTAENTLHEAFLNAFIEIYAFDSALNHEINYIAIDLNSVFEDVREPLAELLQNWADSHGYELLIAEFDELVASGYIVQPPDRGGFKDGLHFGFDNAVFDNETLTVGTSKYRGPLAAVWIEFTVQFTEGDWIVEPPTVIMVA